MYLQKIKTVWRPQLSLMLKESLILGQGRDCIYVLRPCSLWMNVWRDSYGVTDRHHSCNYNRSVVITLKSLWEAVPISYLFIYFESAWHCRPIYSHIIYYIIYFIWEERKGKNVSQRARLIFFLQSKLFVLKMVWWATSWCLFLFLFYRAMERSRRT